MDSATITGLGKSGQKLTEEEVMEKYGHIPLDFYSYFKFYFLFQGWTPDGISINARYGGTPERIKGFHLLTSVSRDLSQFMMQEWDHIVIRDVEGRTLFERRGEK